MFPNTTTQTNPVLEALREALGLGQKNDPTSLTPVGPYGHGTGGLFSQAGQDPMVFSAIMPPTSGALAVLPVVNDADDTDSGPNFGGVENEFITTVTGVTKGALETFANQPTTECADGARAGLMKVGTLAVGSGNYRFAPNAPVNIVRAGQRRDRADPLTLRLMNNPATQQAFGIPTAIASAENALLNEVARRNFEMAISMARFLGQQVYTASPANNNGAARQFMGLDLWINTGNKRDAYTSNVITALDSDVKNFGYALVGGAVRDIQNYAETMLAFLEYKVIRQKLGTTWDGFILMRPEAWDEISKVIAVRQYQEAMNQAALFNNARLMIDGAQALQYRNMIRSQMIWPLRGRNVRVVLDDGIAEQTPNQTGSLIAGQYASSIYFVPLRVLGGIPVTYWKYYDHLNLNSLTLERMPGSATFTSDRGMFRWYVNSKNGCLDWTVQFLPKLIMRTPQIAGRIDNVAYQPLQHFSDAYPDSAYFSDGGRTTSPISQFYTQWSATPTQVA